MNKTYSEEEIKSFSKEQLQAYWNIPVYEEARDNILNNKDCLFRIETKDGVLDIPIEEVAHITCIYLNNKIYQCKNILP